LGDGMTAPPPSQPKASPPWTPTSRGAAPWPATEDLQPIPSIASSLYTAHRRLAQSPLRSAAGDARKEGIGQIDGGGLDSPLFRMWLL
jgi:hypothetical protein